jgi:uncharacterized protein YecE (DUF72 family)
MTLKRIQIGTAGWSIPRLVADRFPAEGTALERYAAEFDVVEINSSFHRSHRATTWERWRDVTPVQFKFAVKLPKEITHKRKLVDSEEFLDDFLGQAGALGPKLAVLLVQLPPSFSFDRAVVESFLRGLRSKTSVPIACEPRHVTWFQSDAETLLKDHEVARVAADPAICPAASQPGPSETLAYWRLHGSPAMYRSAYAGRLDGYAKTLARSAAERETWCIFDNTASSAALPDALALRDLLAGG